MSSATHNHDHDHGETSKSKEAVKKLKSAGWVIVMIIVIVIATIFSLIGPSLNRKDEQASKESKTSVSKESKKEEMFITITYGSEYSIEYSLPRGYYPEALDFENDYCVKNADGEENCTKAGKDVFKQGKGNITPGPQNTTLYFKSLNGKKGTGTIKLTAK